VEFFSFDKAYFDRLCRRDIATEQHFVDYFSKLMLIKLRSRVHSLHIIDDIRQETFVRVFKAIQSEGGIRHPERLGAFVNSVCNNVLQEFFRSSARDDSPEMEAAEPPDHKIDLYGMLANKQTTEHVRAILAKLPEKDRQLLRAIFWEERNKDDVCREFGVDRDYLRVMVHRAKNNFKAFYQKSELAGQRP
jgi:RNA polymerase sigma-70 factor (ECF subfamily)